MLYEVETQAGETEKIFYDFCSQANGEEKVSFHEEKSRVILHEDR